MHWFSVTALFSLGCAGSGAYPGTMCARQECTPGSGQISGPRQANFVSGILVFALLFEFLIGARFSSLHMNSFTKGTITIISNNICAKLEGLCGHQRSRGQNSNWVQLFWWCSLFYTFISRFHKHDQRSVALSFLSPIQLQFLFTPHAFLSPVATQDTRRY